MPGILDKLSALNEADLSKLAGRLDALLKNLKLPTGDAGKSGDAAGLSLDQLLAALEAAQRRGTR